MPESTVLAQARAFIEAHKRDLPYGDVTLSKPIADQTVACAKELGVKAMTARAVALLTNFLYAASDSKVKQAQLVAEMRQFGISEDLVQATDIARSGLRARTTTSKLLDAARQNPLARATVLGHHTMWRKTIRNNDSPNFVAALSKN